jgi:hypothetical protein
MTNEVSLPERLRRAYMAVGQHYGYVACLEEAADEIERLTLAYNEVINRLRRVDVWQMELNDICEGKYDATDKCSAVEPPAQYPDHSPIDVEPT